MSTTEHSRLPWFRDSDDRIRDADGNRIGGFSGAGVLVDECNAILTTTAVNTHAALLEAAKYLHHVCKNGEDQGGELDIALDDMQSAIAVAEESAP